MWILSLVSGLSSVKPDGGEDCLMMYPDDGTWNDLECDDNLPFVCEKISKQDLFFHKENIYKGVFIVFFLFVFVFISFLFCLFLYIHV